MSIGAGIAVCGIWAGAAAMCWIGRNEISAVAYVVIAIISGVTTVKLFS